MRNFIGSHQKVPLCLPKQFSPFQPFFQLIYVNFQIAYCTIYPCKTSIRFSFCKVEPCFRICLSNCSQNISSRLKLLLTTARNGTLFAFMTTLHDLEEHSGSPSRCAIKFRSKVSRKCCAEIFAQILNQCRQPQTFDLTCRIRSPGVPDKFSTLSSPWQNSLVSRKSARTVRQKLGAKNRTEIVARLNAAGYQKIQKRFSPGRRVLSARIKAERRERGSVLPVQLGRRRKQKESWGDSRVASLFCVRIKIDRRFRNRSSRKREEGGEK